MREILFRGKGLITGDWCYGFYADGVILTSLDIDEEYFETSEEWESVDIETVGQYTGLNDKNGNRIYEGDRLNCWRSVSVKGDLRGQYYKPLVVSYSEYSGMFILEDTEIKESYQLKHFEVIEIIGNIHDKD